MSAVKLARLASQIEQALTRLNAEPAAGVTVAVALADGTILNHAHGIANTTAQQVMTSGALMPTGSIGKSYVAAVVLIMVADGLLELDAPIAPWFANSDWYYRLPNYHTITLRQLLNHSSGLIDHVFDTGTKFLKYLKHKINTNQASLPFCPLDLVQFSLDQEPLFSPGQGFHYSDTGYILIGMIIEQASSLSYFQQLSQRILAPQKLTNTLAFDRCNITGLVQGYPQQSQRLFAMPKQMLVKGNLVIHPSLEWTGGGLVSTTADLVRWAKLLFEAKVIAPHLLNEMLTSIAVPTQAETNELSYGYGLGINISHSKYGNCYHHDGFFPGYKSILTYYPAAKVALAMQVNTDGCNISPWLDEITSLVFNNLNL
ncbi:serine hydrolase domain-containing protein [Rheinheimera sp. MMS21-TC3]|uniref:serine hydrolase domain-containing protein n=1 Tax=Rheinheimera sp. MMS21-TC3 TaxID=3072790 RepID=UPI0028C436EC|nr:serine hydrolase domain-containing protein [Rheinheimera sp. MMS21-TC3]WNO61346.1 serine hydrolase domain-containing protein [Rheinheimera sp. MMS21-TC3]